MVLPCLQFMPWSIDIFKLLSKDIPVSPKKRKNFFELMSECSFFVGDLCQDRPLGWLCYNLTEDLS